MARIQLSQRMYSIRDINRLLDSHEMQVQPKYQRRRTPWPLNAKTALIDTILSGFPIPPVYLRDYVNSEGNRKKEIIDGQQRISTISEYSNGEFALSKNIFEADLAGCFYDELPAEEKNLIEDFEVSFISIRGASDSDIVSIFSRLNSFSLPLNNQEKRNSKFTGEMKTLIYELATEYNTFWLINKVLTENQIARMMDAVLVSDIIFTVLKGYQTSSSGALDRLYSDFDDDFQQKRAIYENFNSIMTVIGLLFEVENIRKTFAPKFMFYSMFNVIYAKLYGFESNQNERIGQINIEQSKLLLNAFCENYASPNFDPDIKNKFKQATGNIGQRKFRHAEISKLIV